MDVVRVPFKDKLYPGITCILPWIILRYQQSCTLIYYSSNLSITKYQYFKVYPALSFIYHTINYSS